MKYFSVILTALIFSLSHTGLNAQSAAPTPEPEKAGEPYIVDLTAVDYAFAMPSEIKSGWVTFRFNNMGKATHYALIEKKSAGMPLDVFKQRIQDRDYLYSRPVGGPGFHSSGAKSEMTLFLEPGHYALVCNAQTTEGETHKELGMVKYVQVLEDSAKAPEPKADLQIDLQRYTIKANKPFEAGKQTAAIYHSGGSVYDLHFFKRNDTSSMEGALDFMIRLQDPQLVHFVGGVEQGLASTTSYLTLDLQAGTYGMSSHEFGHFGMYRQFTVSENGGDNRFLREQEDINWQSLHFTARTGEDRLGMPERLEAGPHEFIFTNKTDEVHQPALFRLQEGKTTKEFLDAMISIAEDHKPPRTHDHVERPILGMFLDFTATAPGESNTFKADLAPGRYLSICFSSDGTEEPHYLARDETYFFEVY